MESKASKPAALTPAENLSAFVAAKFGGVRAQAAKALGVIPQAFNNWINNHQPVPGAMAFKIEVLARSLKHKVKAEALVSTDKGRRDLADIRAFAAQIKKRRKV